MINQRFGRLLVVAGPERRERCGETPAVTHWLCRCDCGKEKLVRTGNLKSGGTQSCGCLHAERWRGKRADDGPHSPERIARRLEARTDKNGPTQPHMDSPCWELLGRRDPYARLWIGGGRREHGHRLAWLVTYGDPGAHHILHRCDNPRCVRPDHLFLGSHADNMADMARKKRQRFMTSYTYLGEDRPLSEIARLCGIDVKILSARLRRRGWSLERATTIVPRKPGAEREKRRAPQARHLTAPEQAVFDEQGETGFE